jgi:hypothetical protein
MKSGSSQPKPLAVEFTHLLTLRESIYASAISQLPESIIYGVPNGGQ